MTLPHLEFQVERFEHPATALFSQEIVSFTFGIGIQPIKMKLSQLLIKDGGQCFSYIRSSSSITILGSWFLQAYYTAFDYEASTISFAKPAAITSFVAPKLPNEKGKGLSTVLVAAIVLGGLLILAIIIYLIYQQFQKRKSANLTPPPMQQQYQYPQFQNGGQPNYYPQQPPGQYPQQSGIPPQYPQQAYNAPPQSQYPQLSSQRPQSEQYVSNPPQLSNQRPMSDQYPQLANQASQINQQYPTFQGPGTPPIQGQSEQPRIVSVENQV